MNRTYHEQQQSHTAEREAGRLLKLLAPAGASASPSLETARKKLIVTAPRNGISVACGTSTPAAGEALVDSGAAVWTVGASGRRRLELTPEGRMRLRRNTAAGDLKRQGLPHDIDPFRMQHAALEICDFDGAEKRDHAIIDARESPLVWLRRRKGADGLPLIGSAAFEAGERLRRDLTIGGALPRLGVNWAPRVSTSAYSGSDPSGAADATIAARQRTRQALDACGSAFAGLLIDVCGFLKGLDLIERERGWPARSAKVVLALALARLAEHYGLSDGVVGVAHRQPRFWHVGSEVPAHLD